MGPCPTCLGKGDVHLSNACGKMFASRWMSCVLDKGHSGNHRDKTGWEWVQTPRQKKHLRLSYNMPDGSGISWAACGSVPQSIVYAIPLYEVDCKNCIKSKLYKRMKLANSS